MKRDAKNHIQSVPRIESHYCRSGTKKEYIEGGRTVADLHRDYVQTCEELGKKYENYQMFSTIFKAEFNISFYIPKKDQCDFCLGFQNSTEQEKSVLQEQYNAHINEKQLSRQEKETDKKSTDKVITLFDLQAALPCPQGDSSSFYYVSKLNVYNLTLYEMYTCDTFCFIWHEGHANRGANEIGSCLWNYLSNLNAKVKAKLDIVFYSDNCAGQNKNKFIFALYIYAVSTLENINSITHKFLESGHTQNEGDHIHSLIERAIKKFKRSSPIYVPEQYVSIIKQAKKRGKTFTVHELAFSEFFDLKLLAQDIGMKEAFKTENGDSVQLSKISVLKATKEAPEILLYKTSYREEEFHRINILQNKRQRSSLKKINLKTAYKKKVGITAKKKESLLSLFAKKKNGVSVMPQYYKEYYENL